MLLDAKMILFMSDGTIIQLFDEHRSDERVKVLDYFLNYLLERIREASSSLMARGLVFCNLCSFRTTKLSPIVH